MNRLKVIIVGILIPIIGQAQSSGTIGIPIDDDPCEIMEIIPKDAIVTYNSRKLSVHDIVWLYRNEFISKDAKYIVLYNYRINKNIVFKCSSLKSNTPMILDTDYGKKNNTFVNEKPAATKGARKDLKYMQELLSKEYNTHYMIRDTLYIKSRLEINETSIPLYRMRYYDANGTSSRFTTISCSSNTKELILTKEDINDMLPAGKPNIENGNKGLDFEIQYKDNKNNIILKEIMRVKYIPE